MHLILLLNFNTELAIYPADEIELIILVLGISAAGASGTGLRSAPCSCGSGERSSWLVLCSGR